MVSKDEAIEIAQRVVDNPRLIAAELLEAQASILEVELVKMGKRHYDIDEDGKTFLHRDLCIPGWWCVKRAKDLRSQEEELLTMEES